MLHSSLFGSASSVVKKLGLCLSLLVPVCICPFASAESQRNQLQSSPESAVVNSYADHVFKSYSEVLAQTETLKTRIDEFLKAPSASTLQAAKDQWTAAREKYSRTEVFRFYGGPIDGENGPEGAINAWPLDEAYIDYVRGASNSGIINDKATYPTITAELLRSLNEKDGEKNISTGWHAIEFLLWGQDLNELAPGDRPFTDYVNGRGKNADRRTEYLRIVTDLLLEDLSLLKAAWDPSKTDNFQAGFRSPDQTKEVLGFILTGAVRMAGLELSQERMFVAYDTQLQEDEHSCFSDTTHLDIINNFLGIKEVLLGDGKVSMLQLIAQVKPELAKEIEKSLAETESLLRGIPAPFDQAIFSEEGRIKILAGVEALEAQAKLLEQAATALGLELVAP